LAGAIVNLTTDQKRIYFEHRLSGQKLQATDRNIPVRCPFHDDKRSSLSLNIEKGVWNCHAGCGKGGVLDFEKRSSSCDTATAWANIGSITGAQDSFFQQQPEAVYKYRDENGAELFEKLRYPQKRFTQRGRTADGKTVYTLADIRKVLYNLPEVITANTVAIVEGEKDADNLRSFGEVLSREYPRTRFAATTNFDGAGKWRAEYSPYLCGKNVVIFPDNDSPGDEHARIVASSVFPYASSVRVVKLPGLDLHGDVSDYLQTRKPQELIAEIKKAPQWKPEKGNLLIEAPHFLSALSPEIDWLVEGVIQRGANGFLCSLPKVGKSWLAVDLALAVALGQPWVGFNISRPAKVALITREDNPALTRWRMDRLLSGRDRIRAELADRLYVNSREQSPEFRLDKPEVFAPMIAELKAVKPEFAILDVFNILHAAEENDNTQMRSVLEEMNRLQREVGCAIGAVHHFNKYSEGSLTQRLRGSSAIAGWAEWLIGVETMPGDGHVRQMHFELKAGESPNPVHYRVTGEETDLWKRIERTDWTPEKPAKRTRAEDFVQ
jgi:AAA domain/CHC2 zinc finger